MKTAFSSSLIEHPEETLGDITPSVSIGDRQCWMARNSWTSEVGSVRAEWNSCLESSWGQTDPDQVGGREARPWWFFCSWVPPWGSWQCMYMLGTGARVFVGGEVIVALTSHLKAVTFCFHPCQHTHLPWNLEQSSHECGYLGIFFSVFCA